MSTNPNPFGHSCDGEGGSGQPQIHQRNFRTNEVCLLSPASTPLGGACDPLRRATRDEAMGEELMLTPEMRGVNNIDAWQVKATPGKAIWDHEV
jgi:hypothetical protein